MLTMDNKSAMKLHLQVFGGNHSSWLTKKESLKVLHFQNAISQTHFPSTWLQSRIILLSGEDSQKNRI